MSDLIKPYPLSGLPFNRKERYFTATVLPAIIGCDDFRHLDRFLKLCGLTGVLKEPPSGPEDLVFYTEYGIAESMKPAGGSADLTGATPDVVIAGDGWLLAVEAKMYSKFDADDLTEQLAGQAKVLKPFISKLDRDNFRHVLLLPRPSKDFKGIDALSKTGKVVWWDDVLQEYSKVDPLTNTSVAPQYWLNILRLALDSYVDNVSKAGQSGKNSDKKLKGDVIWMLHGLGQQDHTYVGRKGGYSKFREDVAAGKWQTTKYEVSVKPVLGEKNWFPISEFIGLIEQAAERGWSPPPYPAWPAPQSTED